VENEAMDGEVRPACSDSNWSRIVASVLGGGIGGPVVW